MAHKPGLVIFIAGPRILKAAFGVTRSLWDITSKYNPHTPQNYESETFCAVDRTYRNLTRRHDVQLDNQSMTMPDVFEKIRHWCRAVRAVESKYGVHIAPFHDTEYQRDIQGVASKIISESFVDGKYVPSVHERARRFFLDLQRSYRGEGGPAQRWAWKETIIGTLDETETPCDRGFAQPMALSHDSRLLRLNTLRHDPIGAGCPRRYDTDYLIPRSQVLDHLGRPSEAVQPIIDQRRQNRTLHRACQSLQDFEYLHVGSIKTVWAAAALGWQSVCFRARGLSAEIDRFHAQQPNRSPLLFPVMNNLLQLVDWRPKPTPSVRQISDSYQAYIARQVYELALPGDHSAEYHEKLDRFLNSLRLVQS